MSVTPSGLHRRTVTVSGHRTSVALEPVFWDAITEIAEARGQTITSVIGEIDAGRPGNLSSALRVFVVEQLQSRNGGD